MSRTTACFAFGKNWSNFLCVLNEERIQASTERLQKVVGNLRGKTFLDVGCGSGIHSLAAVRLGASRIHSFDYDQDSVNCGVELKRRFAPESNWTIERGSALDENYLRSLGKFDVVYSWDVLHHTGEMWKALDLVRIPASELLMIAIYNDQEGTSRRWKWLKKRYNSGGPVIKRAAEIAVWAICWGKFHLIDICTLRPHRTIQVWRDYRSQRGMSPWHDIVDWAGGYPFEVAKPEEIFQFFRERGFILESMSTCGGGKGCNEFLFSRRA